jgi:hypothetical protein
MALLIPTGTLQNEHTGPLHECSIGFFPSAKHELPPCKTKGCDRALILPAFRFRDLTTRRFAAQELFPPNSQYLSSQNGLTSLFRNSGFWKSSPPSFQLVKPEIMMWINSPDPPVVDGTNQIVILRFGGLKIKTSILPVCGTRDHDVDQWSRSTYS